MLITLLATLIFASPPTITENNTRIIYASEIHSTGEMELLLDVSKLPSGTISSDTDAYTIDLASGDGRSNVINVEDFSTTNQKVTTILAFDTSASIVSKSKTRAYRNKKIKVLGIKAFLNSAKTFIDFAPQSNHEIDILTSGQQTVEIGKNLSPSDAKKELKKLKKSNRWTNQNTFLRKILTDAIDRANKSNPVTKGGVRQVILFSDGLESDQTINQSDIDQIVQDAIEYGVQVHFFFYAANKELTQKEIDNYDLIASISKKTGGELVTFDRYEVKTKNNLQNGAQKIASGINKKVRLTVDFCGITSKNSTYQDTIKVKVFHNGTTEGDSSISSEIKVQPTTKDPCPCEPTCSIIEKCEKAKCVERFPFWVYFLPLIPLLGWFLWLLVRKNKNQTENDTEENFTPPAPTPQPESSPNLEPLSAGAYSPPKKKVPMMVVKYCEEGQRGEPKIIQDFMVSDEIIYIGLDEDGRIFCSSDQSLSSSRGTIQFHIRLTNNREVWLQDYGSGIKINSSSISDAKAHLLSRDFEDKIYLSSERFILIQPPRFTSGKKT